jgi:hypothetical protein
MKVVTRRRERCLRHRHSARAIVDVRVHIVALARAAGPAERASRQ